jgi:hypothetical protein
MGNNGVILVVRFPEFLRHKACGVQVTRYSECSVEIEEWGYMNREKREEQKGE